MPEVLNIPLYNALQRAFKGTGGVTIENRGASASVDVPVETVARSALSRGKTRLKLNYGGEHYAVRCPFCGDHKRHLWISHVWGSSVQVGNKYYLMGQFPAICFRRNCLKHYDNRQKLRQLIQVDLREVIPINSQTISEEDWQKEEAVLPVNAISVDSPDVPPYIREYLSNRGLNPMELAKDWEVKVGLIEYYGKWPCLIFPIRQRGVLKGWQARFIGEDFEKGNFHKYYIPPGMKKAWMLYNMDRAKFHPIVVISEGVTDVIKIGPAGVALFGMKMPFIAARLCQNVSNCWEVFLETISSETLILDYT